LDFNSALLPLLPASWQQTSWTGCGLCDVM